MQEITERQRIVLALIVRDYVNTSRPVGSKRLVDKYSLEFSPATIRNEMAALTDMGLLQQPYTSAGRIPSEEGYRYFVGRLMGYTELPTDAKQTIRHQFYQARHDADQWLKLAASVLADQSKAASMITAPYHEGERFKHIELISTRGRQVLLVMVLTSGEVHQQVLTLTDVVPQEKLSSISRKINDLCEGSSAGKISKSTVFTCQLEEEVIRLVVSNLENYSNRHAGKVYRDGYSNILAEPEFSDIGSARRALRVFDEESILEELITRAFMKTSVAGVDVLIGGEGDWEELRDYSVVLSNYGAPGIITGTLGLLGPIRMSYSQNISIIRFVAGILSELVVDTLVD